MIFSFDRHENIVGKGENAGLPAFSPFPSMFSKRFFTQGRQKSGVCGKESNLIALFGRLV